MPEIITYEVAVETRVVVTAVSAAGTRKTVVGEYTVRSGAAPGPGFTCRPGDIPGFVDTAMARVTKAAKTMAAGVDNTERNRLK